MKRNLLNITGILVVFCAQAQERLTLNEILPVIAAANPSQRSFDAQIRSLDEAAKGARNWDAPKLSTGFWMTPYNPTLWKRQSDGSSGMGQYMISGEQMLPNRKMQDAEAKYMESMSLADKERKNASLNELYAVARKNYYEWVVMKKKLAVLDQDEKVLDFMIKSAELRYKNNLGKIGPYYKAKASQGNIESMRIMLENEIMQKRIALNTVMNRNKNIVFDIDTLYTLRDYAADEFDSSWFINSRSDIKAIEKDIQLLFLQQDVERAKLRPEYGVRFDHMFGFGGFPMQYTLMGMVRLPMARWSSRASKANVESLKWKAESLARQRESVVNEATGISYGLKNEIQARQKQVRLYERNIIPALQRNFQTIQLGYEQNTEELFTLFDAWETLNMTQLQYLDLLQQLLVMQVEMAKILELN